jgi:ABC-type tungstate transport system permease subunit
MDYRVQETSTPAIRALHESELDGVSGGDISGAQAQAVVDSIWNTAHTIRDIYSYYATGGKGPFPGSH